ncbi:MAG TPA: 3-deoxy-7-phosphoheptulonate synthase [Rhodanobacter sp.]|nr:3-deoxy-7-phosphoheptulonate synthase [Rhodanobacter sp.]
MNSRESLELNRWLPRGWRDKELRHMPRYPQEDSLTDVTTSLSRLPGLVDAAEVHSLKAELAAAGEGRMFVLQLGNSNERFEDASSGLVSEHMKSLESVRKYLALMLGKPVLPIGLVAGNYAKSCAHPTEEIDGITVTSYYGDMANEISPDPRGRNPDASRMLMAYEAALQSLRSIRHGQFKAYTSHEGANLHFEEALVRRGSVTDGFYASSTHLLWLEGINLFSGSGYLEFLRGVLNPIGIRVGPTLAPADLLSTYMLLNPNKEPGKIVVLTSLGAKVSALRDFIHVLREAAAPVVWMCDPLWENMVTRRADSDASVSDVIAEVEKTALLHADEGGQLAGLRLEVEHDPFIDKASRSGCERGSWLRNENGISLRSHGLDFLQALHVCSNLARAYKGIR